MWQSPRAEFPKLGWKLTFLWVFHSQHSSIHIHVISFWARESLLLVHISLRSVFLLCWLIIYRMFLKRLNFPLNLASFGGPCCDLGHMVWLGCGSASRRRLHPSPPGHTYWNTYTYNPLSHCITHLLQNPIQFSVIFINSSFYLHDLPHLFVSTTHIN